MKFTLPKFSLDLTCLWNKPNGPNLPEVNRQSLETAERALKAKFQSGEIGFYDWPERLSENSLRSMESVAAELRERFEGALIIGIGGSFLGPLAITEALQTSRDQARFPLFWLSNVDEPEMRRVSEIASQKRLATIITSKSGNTVETLSGFFHLASRLPANGYVAITDPESGELRRLVTAERWKSLEVPPNIGGRFSVLTAVGLMPALLAGLNARALLTGAAEMRAYLEKQKPEENAAYLLALSQFLWDSKYAHPMQYVMPYQANLKRIGDWCVQLWGESLGKKLKSNPNQSVGFTPVGALGTTDQHSLLQLFKEGPNNKVVGFIDVQSSPNALKVGAPPFTVKGFDYLYSQTFSKVSSQASLATEQSLTNSGVPTYRLGLPPLSEEVLGALFFFLETSCAFAGELYGVNAFDQPGVEESKKLLRASL